MDSRDGKFRTASQEPGCSRQGGSCRLPASHGRGPSQTATLLYQLEDTLGPALNPVSSEWMGQPLEECESQSRRAEDSPASGHSHTHPGDANSSKPCSWDGARGGGQGVQPGAWHQDRRVRSFHSPTQTWAGLLPDRPGLLES